MTIFKKYFSWILLCMCFSACFSIRAYAGREERFAGGEGYLPGNISAIQGVSGTFSVYAATDRGLYYSDDRGVIWQRIDVAATVKDVRDISISDGQIYLASDKGLYIGSIGEDEWIPVLGKKDLRGVLSVSEGNERIIIAWSKKGLFSFGNDHWINIGRPVIWEFIRDVIYSRGKLFVYADNKISVSDDLGDTWKEFTLFSKVSGLEDTGGNNADEESDAINVQEKGLLADLHDGRVAASTCKGIFLLDPDEGIAGVIDTTGLPSSKVRAILFETGCLYASTGNRLFTRGLGGGEWNSLLVIGGRGNIGALGTLMDRNGEEWIYASRGKLLYWLPRSSEVSEESPYDLSRADRNVPTVREVQEMAIEYAEVSPGKIEKWRKAARWKAILPRLSVGYSEGRDDNVEIYKSATTSYVIQGPRECDNDWNVDVSWDLSDIIWNDAQTAIDTRSKLMVQLREDILEEVTRLYFERERILRKIDLRLDEESSEDRINKEIKIEELTAYIDALTGGKFSKALSRR